MHSNVIASCLSFLCLCSCIPALGQVVWTVPAFPTQFDDVTVYFNASEGNGALEGFNEPVYAHTGVITSESANGNDWRHVIGNWGTPDPRVLMTKEDTNLYSLSYNITDFYGVPVGEEVLRLAFVFRNVNGSIVGRDTDGSDIFTDVYPSGEILILTLRSPGESDVIFYEDDSLLIDVAISDTAFLRIYDDAVLIYSDTTASAFFYYHPVGLGPHSLTIEATADTTIIRETEYYVIERNPDRMDPPVGTVNGLNYQTDSTYLFQLFAPLKEHVFLLCPANEFTVDTDFQLQLGEDGSTWWIELPRILFENGNAAYQYLVDGHLRIADPFSTVVLDPWNDPWVNTEVLEELPKYPQGMATGIVTAFDERYEPYDFVVDQFEKPEKVNLVIYELLIRDFLTDHSYVSLIDTLDYLERLGLNAIELMPVHEFEGNDSWGYNPSFHMAVDKYYGTREQLKQFIDAAHQRGIAVILDVVFNHTFGQGPLAQLYWDAMNSRPSAESPYLNPVARHPFNVGFDFNHESPATKQWVKRILTYWITEFKFDGFRFDLSKGLTQFNSGNNIDLMGQYDASRIAILKDYADHIWSLDPESYVIMEHFAANNEEIELSDYGMMLWGNVSHQFGEAAMGYASDLEGADYTVRGWNDPHLVAYMESHDEERLMYRLLQFGDDGPGHNTRELTTALKRIEAASTVFYSIPGPKMLWEFGELGFDYSINWCTDGTINNSCRLVPKPVRWDYLLDYRREQLRQVTSAMIHLRTSVPAFSTEDFVFADGNFFLKTVHLNHPGMDAAVLANFRVVNSDINPKFQYTGTWYEYFTGDTLEVTDTQERITFGPGEYRIYTSERIVPPNGFISGTGDLPVFPLDLFPTLVGVESTVFAVLPSEASVVDIQIVDISGTHSVSCYYEIMDGHAGIVMPDGLASGMYVVQVRTEEGVYVGKVVRQ